MGSARNQSRSLEVYNFAFEDFVCRNCLHLQGILTRVGQGAVNLKMCFLQFWWLHFGHLATSLATSLTRWVFNGCQVKEECYYTVQAIKKKAAQDVRIVNITSCAEWNQLGLSFFLASIHEKILNVTSTSCTCCDFSCKEDSGACCAWCLCLT